MKKQISNQKVGSSELATAGRVVAAAVVAEKES
jgi:hypothetical protein